MEGMEGMEEREGGREGGRGGVHRVMFMRSNWLLNLTLRNLGPWYKSPHILGH